MNAAWEDDGRDHTRVNFGRKAQRWLRQRLAQEILRLVPDAEEEIDWAQERAELLAWFLEQHIETHCLATWRLPDDFFSSPRDRGWWHFEQQWVVEHLENAWAELGRQARRKRDASKYGTLAQWLRAERAGTLEYSGDTGGTRRLSWEQRDALAAAEVARRARFAQPAPRKRAT